MPLTKKISCFNPETTSGCHSRCKIVETSPGRFLVAEDTKSVPEKQRQIQVLRSDVIVWASESRIFTESRAEFLDKSLADFLPIQNGVGVSCSNRFEVSAQSASDI